MEVHGESDPQVDCSCTSNSYEIEKWRLSQLKWLGWFQIRLNHAGIQVTRAIGDLDMKTQGVTALPEVTVHTFDPQVDEFLVLACDGLWDVCSNEDVIELVKTTVKV